MPQAYIPPHKHQVVASFPRNNLRDALVTPKPVKQRVRKVLSTDEMTAQVGLPLLELGYKKAMSRKPRKQYYLIIQLWSNLWTSLLTLWQRLLGLNRQKKQVELAQADMNNEDWNPESITWKDDPSVLGSSGTGTVSVVIYQDSENVESPASVDDNAKSGSNAESETAKIESKKRKVGVDESGSNIDSEIKKVESKKPRKVGHQDSPIAQRAKSKSPGIIETVNAEVSFSAEKNDMVPVFPTEALKDVNELGLACYLCKEPGHPEWECEQVTVCLNCKSLLVDLVLECTNNHWQANVPIINFSTAHYQLHRIILMSTHN